MVLPIVAEQFASFAAAKEPEVKAYLAGHFGHGSPLVEEVFKLLVEPGLVTIGGLMATVGSAAPAPAAHRPDITHHLGASQAAGPIIPTYNDD